MHHILKTYYHNKVGKSHSVPIYVEEISFISLSLSLPTNVTQNVI